MNAEIITIGDEILFGQITDTNSQYISNKLTETGINVVRQSSIADKEDAIFTALTEAEQRADIILITGGLGPTKDDITKKVLNRYFNSEMIFKQEVLDNIVRLFKFINREVTELNKLQAFVPEVCEIINNKRGTAPGMWFNKNGKVFISMPGVPHEMHYMLTNGVIPKIKENFETPVIYHKSLKSIGVPEAKLATVLHDWEVNLPSHIKLAYLPHLGQIRLRLTARGNDLETLKSAVEKEAIELRKLAEKYIYADENIQIEEAIGKLLLAKNQTIALAESCTGGFVMSKITSIPGCSEYFNGGIVSYSNEVKISQLGVKPETLKEHGAVSEETVIQMAVNVREKYQSDYGLAVTGVAGPGGGTKEKPVGTVWIGLATPNETITKLLTLTPDRNTNINFSFTALMDLLRKNIN